MECVYFNTFALLSPVILGMFLCIFLGLCLVKSVRMATGEPCCYEFCTLYLPWNFRLDIFHYLTPTFVCFSRDSQSWWWKSQWDEAINKHYLGHVLFINLLLCILLTLILVSVFIDKQCYLLSSGNHLYF